jgi:ubiquinone/menaquinone biosynthesis C-methylase UbiE
VHAHGATGVGVDPVAIHVERARDAVVAAGLAGRIEIVHGVMETLPHPDGSFHFICCRDVKPFAGTLPRQRPAV